MFGVRCDVVIFKLTASAQSIYTEVYVKIYPILYHGCFLKFVAAEIIRKTIVGTKWDIWLYLIISWISNVALLVVPMVHSVTRNGSVLEQNYTNRANK